MDRALSVAGKLFLCGEYAVLWGGTARVVCAGPRLQALVQDRPDRRVEVLLEGGRLSGQATTSGVAWAQEVPPAFRFVARALGEVYRAHRREALGLALALSASSTHQGHKLGLGGSASATVLAVEAARYVLQERLDPLKVALLAHAACQQGRGSGADVAAVFAGGVVRYRRYPVEPLARASAEARSLEALLSAPPVDLFCLPMPALYITYAFGGTSASTPALIARAEARLDGPAREAFVSESDGWGEELEASLLRGDIQAARRPARALQGLLRGVGGVETEELRRILALAETFGAAGKLSGAGGGDGCLLLSPDGAARTQLLEALTARGVHALPLEVEEGLRGEAAASPPLRRWIEALAG